MVAVSRYSVFGVLVLVCCVMVSIYLLSNSPAKTWMSRGSSLLTSISTGVPKPHSTDIMGTSLVVNRNNSGLPTKASTVSSVVKSISGRPPKINLIIVTYMRSGSSLTGNMFEYDPKVFYVFEPMHDLKWLWWGNSVLAHYLNKPKHPINTERQYARYATQTVRNIFNCKFQDIDVETLSQSHHSRSESTRPYWRCISRKPGVANVPKCIPMLNNRCRTSKVRVIKTIEYPMSSAANLIQLSRSVRVIHLIRDPRATIASQVATGRRTWSNISNYCQKVLKDVRVTEKLLKTSPSSIKLLFYEDLCANPVSVVRSLYDFSGLAFTERSRKTVESFTSARENRRCLYCTVRSDSSVDAGLWRNNITMEHVKVIDDNCQEVYQKLGYLPVESEDMLRNLSYPLKSTINL